MRLRTIREAWKGEENPDDVFSVEETVETLEELVDDRKGHLTAIDRRNLEEYLSKFSPGYLKKVAALLGSADASPAGMADGIVNGQLIAYVGGNANAGKPSFVGGEHDVPDFDFDIDDDFMSLPFDDGPGVKPIDPFADDIPEPTAADLRSIENENKPAAPGREDYENRPPAFRGQPGQSPDPRQLDDRTKYRLDNLSPADIIDSPNLRPEVTQPFIYKGGKGARLFIGSPNTYHYGILNAVGADHDVLTNIYYGGSFDDNTGDNIPGSSAPGVVGRIGHNFSKIDPKLAGASLVAMYAREGSKDPSVVRAAAQELVQGGYVPPDAILCYGGKAVPLTEILGGASQATASNSDRLWAQLDSKYYLSRWTPEMVNKFLTAGEWPNRTPMTPEEKALIAKKFNISSPIAGVGGSQKNKWQSEMEKAGIITPGQRWWAPTSESKKRK